MTRRADNQKTRELTSKYPILYVHWIVKHFQSESIKQRGVRSWHHTTESFGLKYLGVTGTIDYD